MKQKKIQTKQQAFKMLALYEMESSYCYHNQAGIAKMFEVTQGYVSQQLKWARAWQKIAKDIQTYKEAYENTVEMSTNGFPGHLDNVGEDE